jgi:hypothetical protein
MNAKKLIFGAAAAVGVFAAGAHGQITGSGHDFSSYSWSRGEICLPCHTPHFGNPEVGALWNHALTNATYTMFEGEEGTAEANLDRVSRLCMSCHDGTVALDSYGGTEGTNFIPTSARIGTDLQDDHPIGSDGIYPTEPSNSFHPQDPVTHRVTWDGRTLRLRSWIDENGVEQWVVGCRTCHDPHNRGNFGNGAMLQYSNAGSALCLTCHIK